VLRTLAMSRWLHAALSVLAVSLSASPAFGYAGGATATDLVGPAGCANCHAPNVPSATGSVRFEAAPVRGQPVEVTVDVSGPGSAAGYLLIISDGVLVAGSGSRSVGEQATQSASLAAPAHWASTWTPSAVGPVAYTLWVVTVDEDGTAAGDHPRRSPIVGSVTVRSAPGDVCADQAECGSGFCVDGRCCNSACGGPCEACSTAAMGAVDGTCTPLVGLDCVAGAACSDAGAAPFFACSCPLGTTGTGRAGSGGCVDVNECASHPCASGGDRDDNGGEDGQGCTQVGLLTWVAPGYTCSCQPGYASGGAPRTCVVADECTRGTHDCDSSPRAACNDPNPAPTSLNDFTCSCPGPAWMNHPVLQGHGASGCVDVDECQAGLAGCDPNATCTNLLGSFTCSCNGPDWVDAGGTGGRVCVDADECAQGTAQCDPNAICTDANPGYQCACAGGYEDAPGTSGGVECVDVDECAVGLHGCDVNATCTNEDGGYTCECNPGFGGSGAACEDVDECALGTGGCPEGERCENRVGAPNLCLCPAGASRDGQGVCGVRCGDGVVGGDEACDDGAANSDTTPDACRTDCRAPSCGDGVVDQGETCDPGGGPGAPARCQCSPDAGVEGDAGLAEDAGSTVDAGLTRDAGGASGEGGGCGCRAASLSPSAALGPAWAGLWALLALRRRRRT
jgi:hypothetical protein